MLQIGRAHLHSELSVLSHRDVARLLADYDTDRIRDLAHAQGGPMAQTEILGNVHIMAHRQDTTHRLYMVA